MKHSSYVQAELQAALNELEKQRIENILKFKPGDMYAGELLSAKMKGYVPWTLLILSVEGSSGYVLFSSEGDQAVHNFSHLDTWVRQHVHEFVGRCS